MAEKIGLQAVLEMANFDKGAAEYMSKSVQMQGSTEHLSTKMVALGTVLGNVATAIGRAVVQGFKDLAGAMSDSISAASDLNESMSKVNVVFAENADEIMAWSETSATAMGMSQQQALEAAGTYGNLFRAMGLTGDAATGMSQDMVELAADLGSFNNIPIGDALEKLRAGLTGEAEPLKALGINMNEATLKAKALELGLISSVKDALDPATKAQAAYALIMEQSSLAQGDFARTSSGLANQQKIVAAQVENLKAKLGTALLPVVTKLTGRFSEIIEKYGPQIAAAFEKVASVIFELSEVFYDLISGSDSAGEHFWNLMLNLGLTSEKSHALTGAFDGVVSFVKDTMIPALAQVGQWLGENIPIAIQAVSGFWTGTLLPALSMVGDFVTNNIIPIFVNIVEWFSNFIPTAIATVSTFFQGHLLPAIGAVWGFIDSRVLPLLSTLAEWIGQNIPVVLQFLADAWKNWLMPALSMAADFITNNLVPTLYIVWDWLADNLPVAIQIVSDFWTGTLQPALQAVWSFIQTSIIPVFEAVWNWLATNIPPAIQALSDLWNTVLLPALQAIWSFIQTSVIPIFEAIADLLGAVVGKAVEALAGLWQNVLQPALQIVWSWLAEKLQPIFEAIGGFINNTLMPALTTFGTFLRDVVVPIVKTLVEEGLEKMKAAFDGIKSAIQPVVDFIKDLADRISKLKLPDWLTPGSPTPFELALSAIGDLLSNLIIKAMTAMTIAFKAASAVWEEQTRIFRDQLIDLYQVQWPTLTSVIISSASAIDAVLSVLASSTLPALRDAFQDAFGEVGALIETAVIAVSSFGAALGDVTVGPLTGLRDAFRDTFGGSNGVTALVSEAANAIRGMAGDLYGARDAANALGPAFTAFRNAAMPAIDAIRAALTGASGLNAAILATGGAAEDTGTIWHDSWEAVLDTIYAMNAALDQTISKLDQISNGAVTAAWALELALRGGGTMGMPMMQPATLTSATLAAVPAGRGIAMPSINIGPVTIANGMDWAEFKAGVRNEVANAMRLGI